MTFETLDDFGPRGVWPEAILAEDDLLDLFEVNDRLFSDILDDRTGDGCADWTRLYDILTEGLKSQIRSLTCPVDSSDIENRYEA